MNIAYVTLHNGLIINSLYILYLVRTTLYWYFELTIHSYNDLFYEQKVFLIRES
jgi:hypothetical protein